MYKRAMQTGVRRVTVNLPKQLLSGAQTLIQGTITQTLIEGLHLVKQKNAYQKLMALKGKIHLDIDIPTSRERTRR